MFCRVNKIIRMYNTWRRLCDASDLELRATLDGGQSFRWKYLSDTGEWTGVFAKTAWKLRENNNCIEYNVLGTLAAGNEENKSKTEIEASLEKFFVSKLREYFRLDVNVVELYEEWAKKDKLFEEASKKFRALRLLKQEPEETVFGFICSQNTIVARIEMMMEKLSTNYGEEICTHEGHVYHAFPDIHKFTGDNIQEELRNLGFGYRAKYINTSAKQIIGWGYKEWFDKLERMNYLDARAELIKLVGVGPKIADCICLMALNHLEAVPVDTHVYQIAAKNYLPALKEKKSVTPQSYLEIGRHFQKVFGPMAGWAQTVLFCGDFKKYDNKNESSEKTQQKKDLKHKKQVKVKKDTESVKALKEETNTPVLRKRRAR